MLQSIRDKSQGWVAGIIVGLLILTFALWGIHSYVTEKKNSGIVAKVNGTSITEQALQNVYERLRQQQRLQLGAGFSGISQLVENQLKKQALNQLVISTLLSQAAYKAGYRVTTNQVNEALLQIPAFQINGQFSIDRFQEMLNSILYTQAGFLADMRRSMLINQVQGGYVNSEFALPNEIATAIHLVNQKRDIRYAIIPSAHFVNNMHISSEAIKTYYQQHPQLFESPAKSSIFYIMLSLADIKATLHFDKTKLQQYYENNLQNYTRPASWRVAYILLKFPLHGSQAEQSKLLAKAHTIYASAQQGEDFSKLARNYSDDDASAKKGGILPWFTMGSLDPVFEKAATSLQKIGDITAPVKTHYGYVIIKLLDQRKAKVLPFSQVQAQVTSALTQQQAAQIFAEKIDKLANLTYANPASLTVAAQALGLPIQKTDFFTREGTKSGITANPHLLATVFSNDIIEQHNNSDVIQLSPDSAVVVRINQYQPARLLPLAEVESAIKTKLIYQYAQKKAEQLGQQLLIQLQQQSVDPVKIAARYSLPWQVDKNVTRFDARVDNAILHQAFSMPPPMNEKLSVTGMRLPSGDYALVMVDAVHEGKGSNNNTQHRIFAEQLEYNNGLMDYKFYVDGIMKQSKIKFFQKESDSSIR